MITRPLDLASQLQPAPRMMDGVFYTNVVLLGLFFAFFGSRFVLSPGVNLVRADFAMASSTGAISGAVSTSAVISVLGPEMVFTDVGRMSYTELAVWLPTQVTRGVETESRLLVKASAGVTAQDLLRLSDLALAAGFSGVQLALEPTQAVNYFSKP
jgi:biopolymer transport protein ExbD